MNIFVLDYNPVRAAQMQCDKHVVKMPLETAQLLCSAFPKGEAPYKQTHVNHPCSIWCREAKENYLWLIEHGLALCDEYEYRYGKIHQSKKVILWCKRNMKKVHFPKKQKTRYTLCFDECYKVGNAVQSYRNFYRQAKRDMAMWNKSRKVPTWY